MNYKYILKSEDDTKKMAEELVPVLKDSIVFLNGCIGAGKTTFTKYFVSSCGLESETSSPTFNIENRYGNEKNLIIHFDLYRLNYEEELDMIGFYDTLREKATILIEWADKFNLAKYIKKYKTISFTINDDGSRTVIVE